MKKIVSLFIVTALAGLASMASADQKVCGVANVPTAPQGTGNCTLAGYGSISTGVGVTQSVNWSYSVNLTSSVVGSIGSGRLINRGGTFTRDAAGNLCKEAKDTNRSVDVRGSSVGCVTGQIGSLHYPNQIRVFLSRP